MPGPETEFPYGKHESYGFGQNHQTHRSAYGLARSRCKRDFARSIAKFNSLCRGLYSTESLGPVYSAWAHSNSEEP